MTKILMVYEVHQIAQIVTTVLNDYSVDALTIKDTFDTENYDLIIVEWREFSEDKRTLLESAHGNKKPVLLINSPGTSDAQLMTLYRFALFKDRIIIPFHSGELQDKVKFCLS